MTHFERMKAAFDEIGIRYTVSTDPYFTKAYKGMTISSEAEEEGIAIAMQDGCGWEAYVAVFCFGADGSYRGYDLRE